MNCEIEIKVDSDVHTSCTFAYSNCTHLHTRKSTKSQKDAKSAYYLQGEGALRQLGLGLGRRATAGGANECHVMSVRSRQITSRASLVGAREGAQKLKFFSIVSNRVELPTCSKRPHVVETINTIDICKYITKRKRSSLSTHFKS